MKTAATLFLVVGILVVSGGRLSAQTDFSGTWTLDRELSADLSKATFEPQQTQTRRNTGFSGGAGGRGGFGGRGRRMPGNDRSGSEAGLTADEHARLRELADYVKGLTSIVVEHTDHSTFTVTDARGRSRLFPTDGSPTQHAFATTTIDSTTRWDGPHMVTTYTIGPSRTLLFTYILVPATKQMALRITLDQSGRQRDDVPELRLVYKLAH